MTAAANIEIDPRRYGWLLARVLTAVVKTAEENRRLLAEIERRMNKGESASPEELALLELMSRLVEYFEKEHYPIPKAKPHAVLRHLVEQRGMQPKDLLPVFPSRAATSHRCSAASGASARRRRSARSFTSRRSCLSEA
jgi:HTH-type transcriptional regulator/antitoxin HigA